MDTSDGVESKPATAVCNPAPTRADLAHLGGSGVKGASNRRANISNDDAINWRANL